MACCIVEGIQGKEEHMRLVAHCLMFFDINYGWTTIEMGVVSQLSVCTAVLQPLSTILLGARVSKPHIGAY